MVLVKFKSKRATQMTKLCLEASLCSNSKPTLSMTTLKAKKIQFH